MISACAGRGTTPPAAQPPAVIPEPWEARGAVEVPPALPPVPPVDGPLQVRVVYPPAGSMVEDTDSAFVFGSAGSGRASLTVNGRPVSVWPNGAWLAWLPLPSGPDPGYEVVARRGTDSTRMLHAFRRRPSFSPPASGLWVDTTSFAPTGRVWWPADEAIHLSVRAAADASVRLRMADGRVIPLGLTPDWSKVRDAIRAFDRDSTNLRAEPRRTLYTGLMPSGTIGGPLDPVVPAGNGSANGDAVLEVARGRDTLRVRWPLQVARMNPPWPWVELDDDRSRNGDTDRIVVGRAAPGATYHWFLPNGTLAPVSGRINGDLRLRLSARQDIWVSAAEAVPLQAGAAPRPAVVGSVTATPGAGRVALRIPVDWRVPFEVEEQPDRIILRLHGAVGDPNWIRYGETGPPLSRVTWRQAGSDVVEFTATLESGLWGYRTRWEQTDLVLDLRSRPVTEPDRPLQGRLIVVDPGHPPAGSTGPTGLTEAEANLGVALVLERMLADEGARVVLTRRDGAPLDLWSRVRLADSLDADLLISIHNNALPDGVNPFTNNGSSVFYFHPRGIELARAIQRELGKRLPLRDLGVARGDLALVRGTWMPSVLVEGLFMMLPEQEAALRSEAGRRAYAESVLAGIRAFLSGSGGRPGL